MMVMQREPNGESEEEKVGRKEPGLKEQKS